MTHACHVYLARCSDGRLSAGHTCNLAAREKAHNAGFGGRYTATRRPVRIVYSEGFSDTEDAVARERQIKRWTVEKKEALIAGNLARLKSLSKRHH